MSPDTISKITDAVVAEVQNWQTRPLDPVYPIVYIDAMVVKVRDHNVVTNKAAHLVIGIDLDGTKHVLGIWLQTTEGAKFWASVLAELRNRGVRDILIVCCDGLDGLPAAIEASFPHAVVQTCVVHLIRAAMRYVSYADRKQMAAALRPMYSAATAEAAEAALAEFAGSELGRRYPAAVATWERAWDRFVPFLAFPPEVRKIIYTTNAIESINYQLRKIIKNRGLFPTDAAVVKLLWLAILDIEDKRAWRREKRTRRQPAPRQAQGAGPVRRGTRHHRVETGAQRVSHRLPGSHPGARAMTTSTPQPPSRNGTVTASCAVCDGPLPAGRITRRYCSDRCRQEGWRRRHQPPPAAISTDIPPARSRREHTIYSCPDCEQRYLAQQWCDDCQRPCRRVGTGGLCQNCDEPLTIEELIDTKESNPKDFLTQKS